MTYSTGKDGCHWTSVDSSVWNDAAGPVDLSSRQLKKMEHFKVLEVVWDLDQETLRLDPLATQGFYLRIDYPQDPKSAGTSTDGTARVHFYRSKIANPEILEIGGSYRFIDDRPVGRFEIAG